MKLPLVVVEWGDAWSHHSWFPGHPETRPVVVTSVGYLLKETKEGVTLLGRIVKENGEMGMVSFIPTGMLIKKTIIKGHDIEVKS